MENQTIHNTNSPTSWETFDTAFGKFIGNVELPHDLADIIDSSMKVFAAIPLQYMTALYLADEYKHPFRLIAAQPDSEFTGAETLFRNLTDDGVTAAVLRHPLPTIHELKSENETVVAALGIPLVVGLNMSGVIVVYFNQTPPQISPERLMLLQSAGLALVLRIENLTLQRQVTNLESLTEQRVAVRTLELQKIKTEYEAIIDYVHSGIVLVAPDTHTIEYANPAAVEVLNSLPEPLAGKNADDFFEDLSQDILAMNYLSMLYYDREKNIRTADGREIPVIQSAATVIFDRRTLLLLTFFDISERKATERRLERINEELEDNVSRRTEELQEIIAKLAHEIEARERSEFALEERERLFGVIFDIIDIGLCVIDSKGVFLRVNDAYCAMFSCTKDEILGQPIELILAEEQRQPTRRLYNEFMASDRAGSTREFSIMDRTGNALDIRISTSSLFMNNGDKISAHAVVDLTEIRQAQHKAQVALEKERQINDLKTNFVAMVSHEFRTPLTTILSYSQLLRNYSDHWPKEQQDRYFNNIEIGVRQLTGLLEDVLLLGETEHDLQTINLQSVNIREFCIQAAEDAEIAFAEGNKRIRTDFYGTSEQAVIDLKVTRRILANILSNALKYSPSNTFVLFSIENLPDTLIFTVTDEGVGISPEYMPRLFEPFSRADNAISVSGTGLGMAIVKNAVELLDGKIDITSAINKGTAITISLPVQQMTAEP
ncbi:MAG: PAS domain S-box protein [Bacteroidetes bacterium]|nr:PAS domain S-box protein [Bacteroidota bacterium]MCZ2133562.1 PAS domain S-box protein [Bacteroidota bacterium]